TGLVMLPPTLVSLPLKLLIFVLADGWSLVVMSLLDGAQIVGT
ncbi:MAG: flagellar type III secretion system pore protein FliP, partial [Pirellulales bacterium]|nr:flagellar type III secretion system pore protein FliP [Pirellulales bacterium]